MPGTTRLQGGGPARYTRVEAEVIEPPADLGTRRSSICSRQGIEPR
jgi:hypothetical protein